MNAQYEQPWREIQTYSNQTKATKALKKMMIMKQIGTDQPIRTK